MNREAENKLRPLTLGALGIRIAQEWPATRIRVYADDPDDLIYWPDDQQADDWGHLIELTPAELARVTVAKAEFDAVQEMIRARIK